MHIDDEDMRIATWASDVCADPVTERERLRETMARQRPIALA
jgi:hypothetical protein